ncbi:hypothetical protein IAR55_003386 [Kwoniella newhampshirensis]|uniref:Uncharacterized protein n=1 Tax=Kwoniella newhampshirensis TaxID=1651941 RepID=A0AAW0YYJ5_9TREE
MAPSALYQRLHSLALSHALPSTLDEILSIRSPTAVHSRGHAHLVSLHPLLGEKMDNAAFKNHLLTTGPYLSALSSKEEGRTTRVHSITIDEWERRGTVHMSYFLLPKGPDLDQDKEEDRHDAMVRVTVTEQDLIWTLKFTDPHPQGTGTIGKGGGGGGEEKVGQEQEEVQEEDEDEEDEEEEDLDQIKIQESVEFIDPIASSRVGDMIRSIHGELNKDVRGGITLGGYGTYP